MYVVVNKTKQSIQKIDPEEEELREGFFSDKTYKLPLLDVEVSLGVLILIILAIVVVFIAIVVGIAFWVNSAPSAPIAAAPIAAAPLQNAAPKKAAAKRKPAKSKKRN
jgi:flagellar basal body-associated protein FliL